jgi:hypothetical protein
MHLDLPHLIWSGPPIDDREMLPRLPPELGAALEERNGCLAWRGAFHVRGACRQPEWHGLRSALEGPDAFCRLYPEVREDDVPWAEDGFGDQLLVRSGRVLRLFAETGELEPRAESVEQFLDQLLADPTSALGFEPVDVLGPAGGMLEPGRLLSVYPPFCTAEAATGVSIRPIETLERRRWLARFAAQLRNLPDGASVRIDPIS